MRVYFFGCWNGPGHFWFAPGGRLADREATSLPFHSWIDTGFQARRFKPGCFMNRGLVVDPACCFAMEGKTDDQRRSIMYDTEEHEQGRYLLHVRNGWTLLSWWDRTQGDNRGACNSNICAEGEHTDEQMVVMLREHFPHVVANLERAGVALVNAR